MKRDENGSKNSLVGIGGINCTNEIQNSFDRLETFKVEDKNGSGSNNSPVRTRVINGEYTIKCSFKLLNRGPVEKYKTNASVSNNSLAGIGVTIGTNTIKSSFNKLQTFKVEDKNGSGSKNSPVIIRENKGKNTNGGSSSKHLTQAGDQRKEDKTNASVSNNSLVRIGVINGEQAFKDKNTMEDSFKQSETPKVEDKKQENEMKKGSGSNNSLAGIGGINGENTIGGSFVQLKTFEVEDKKLEDKKKNGSGSNNSLVGIGVINGKNNIKDSFKRFETLNPQSKP